MLIQELILLMLSHNFRYAHERTCGRKAFMEICDGDEKRPDVRWESADYLWLTILWSIFNIVNTVFRALPFQTLRKIVQFFTRSHVVDCSQRNIFSRREFVYAVVLCFAMVLDYMFISWILWQRWMCWDHWKRYSELSKWTELIVASIHGRSMRKKFLKFY